MKKKAYLKASLNTVKFENYLRRLDYMAKLAALEAITDALEELSQEVILYTPKDTRTLVDSFAYKIVDEGVRVRAEFGFGNIKDQVNPKTGLKASEYVIAVHEDLEARHPNGGQAKFLEIPVMRFKDRYAGIATMTIRRRLESVR